MSSDSSSAPGTGHSPLRALILVGMLYLVVGLASSALSGAAGSAQLGTFWRWSAFAFSAVVFAGHIAYEHLRQHSTARVTAWHAALAVALGALGLALVANIHDLNSASGYRLRMLIALPAWPLLTAVPAYVVALVVAAGLGRKRR